MALIADSFTFPVAGGYKQRDHDPRDVIHAGDYYRSNWRGAVYLLLGKISSVHEGDDLIKMEANCYGDPVYAIANGLVTFAEDVTGTTWRQMIEIEHPLPDGSMVWSRYAHLQTMRVTKGQTVIKGQQIGTIGDSFGAFVPHLHFSICVTNRMALNPRDWPSTGHNQSEAEAIVFANYTDPLTYISERLNMLPNPNNTAALRAALAALPAGETIQVILPIPPEREPLGVGNYYEVPAAEFVAPAPRQTLTKYVTATLGMNVRSTPSKTEFAPVGTLAFQTAVLVYADQPDPAWWQIAAANAQFPGDYLAAQWLGAERP